MRILSRSRCLDRSLLALAACAFGCGGQGIDLQLSVDPEVSTPAELASSLAEISLVLDHEAGLYTADEERTEGPIQIRNIDADPALELISTIPVDGQKLPSIRVERGGIAQNEVDVRLFGLPPGGQDPIAEGGARALPFAEGEPPWTIPFNFRDDLRPPRVHDVLPRDGAQIPGCELSSITLVLSRAMDPASLKNGSVLVTAASALQTTVLVSGSGLAAEILLAPPLAGDGAHVRFHIEVTPSAQAADGTPLDQAGSLPDAQPFTADVELLCGPPPSFPCSDSTCPWACGDHECLNIHEVACQEGVCVPVACNPACEGALLCDPRRNACVGDCRTGEAVTLCAVGKCQSDTGLCE